MNTNNTNTNTNTSSLQIIQHTHLDPLSVPLILHDICKLLIIVTQLVGYVNCN